ncbi:MarR family winged helix-turn-helix transcriptional regulator [Corynebacterium sp.]|uniref:MarR family winged helix-turn-helix transcriptional regulator n=1 Tax=Corynebacterium sp. TaxID=1720 RepID=UPI0026E02F20|nr:MarR family transcriptional regulator [Corynebacterium sp.]MDO5512950.1 MarR family transcriptional regulator [Corynebacterium sp.]
MSTPHPRHAIFAGVLLLSNRMQREYDTRLDGLTLKQWLALAVIGNLPQPVPSTAVIARALGTSHQNTAKLLRALEAKGLIATAPSPADQRARTITSTPAAQFSAADEQWGERMLDELFAGVDDAELTVCLSVLERMSHNLCGESLLPPDMRR